MITEIVTFGIPDGMTRDDVLANYRRSAPTWRANPDLIRKNYIFDPETRPAGRVYLWRTRAGALRRPPGRLHLPPPPAHRRSRDGRELLPRPVVARGGPPHGLDRGLLRDRTAAAAVAEDACGVTGRFPPLIQCDVRTGRLQPSGRTVLCPGK